MVGIPAKSDYLCNARALLLDERRQLTGSPLASYNLTGDDGVEMMLPIRLIWHRALPFPHWGVTGGSAIQVSQSPGPARSHPGNGVSLALIGHPVSAK